MNPRERQHVDVSAHDAVLWSWLHRWKYARTDLDWTLTLWVMTIDLAVLWSMEEAMRRCYMAHYYDLAVRVMATAMCLLNAATCIADIAEVIPHSPLRTMLFFAFTILFIGIELDWLSVRRERFIQGERLFGKIR